MLTLVQAYYPAVTGFAWEAGSIATITCDQDLAEIVLHDIMEIATGKNSMEWV